MHLSVTLLVMTLVTWCQSQKVFTDNECLMCRQEKSFQNLVCAADFVVRIKVTQLIVNNTRLMRYRSDILELFKPQGVPDAFLKSWVDIETAPETTQCKTKLRLNRQYVVSGVIRQDGSLYMDECISVNYLVMGDFPLSDVTLANFRDNFMDNCKCGVQVMDDMSVNALTEDELFKLNKKKKLCVEGSSFIECTNHLTYCSWTKAEGDTTKKCNWADISQEDLDLYPTCISRNWGVSGAGCGSRCG